MEWAEIAEGAEVVLTTDLFCTNDYNTNIVIEKGSEGFITDHAMPFKQVEVTFGKHKVRCLPSQIEPKGGTTMNEKEANNYCAESQLEKQVKELKDEFHEYRKVVNHAVNKLKERVDELESQSPEQAPEELPQLTPIEKHILSLVSEEYEWVAKDPEDDCVCAYKTKPTYDKEYREWLRDDDDDDDDYTIVSRFDVVEFENLPTDRPYRISELIKEG